MMTFCIYVNLITLLLNCAYGEPSTKTQTGHLKRPQRPSLEDGVPVSLAAKDFVGKGNDDLMHDASDPREQDLREVAKSNDAFVPKLYSKLIAENDKNIIMSAFSLECVLAIAFLGTKGETAAQIKNGLALPSKEVLIKGFNKALDTLITDEKDSVISTIANRIYVQKDYELLDSFKKDSNAVKEEMIKEIDFKNGRAATKQINGWVDKETKSKIKDLFSTDSLDGTTRMVLVNALYFKGKWQTKFNSRQTKKEKFYVSDSKIVQADMMMSKTRYSVMQLEGLKAKALKLPYKGDRFNMIIILPDEKNGLAKLETDLADFDFSTGFKFNRPMEYRIQIPKFKIESTFNLKNTLQDIGVKDLFEESKADLSGATGKKDLFVSKIIQKAFIEVNEEGSEAAAATGLVAVSRSMSITLSFICDHPFIFLIKDSKTGLILFNGRVLDPSA